MTTFTGRIGKRELVSYVDPFPALKGSDLRAGRCHRCGGTGAYGPKVVYNGRCFNCAGSGRENFTVATHRRWARAEAYEVDFAEELAAHDRREQELLAEQAREMAAAEQARYEAKEAARVAAMVQGHIGEVGDKVSGIEISVKVAKYNSGSYNRSASMFVIAEDASGKTIKFAGSAASVMNLQKGDKAVITTGRIKDHSEWNGQDQTVLSHVKVEIIEQEDEA